MCVNMNYMPKPSSRHFVLLGTSFTRSPAPMEHMGTQFVYIINIRQAMDHKKSDGGGVLLAYSNLFIFIFFALFVYAGIYLAVDILCISLLSSFYEFFLFILPCMNVFLLFPQPSHHFSNGPFS